MPYRTFMVITRGSMDKTAVCIFPWERPIIEEIHGGNAEEVGVEEMASLKGAARVVTVKLPARNVRQADGSTKIVEAELAPGLKEQLIAMSTVGRDVNPFNNLAEEYGRLEQKYGMHPDVKMSYVEKVLGPLAQFRRLVIEHYKGNKPPLHDPFNPDTSEDALDDENDADAVEREPADMTIAQLREKLDAAGETYKKTAKREELIELYVDVLSRTPA